LIGHSSLIAAYCYWLYHQREPSYHAVLGAFFFPLFISSWTPLHRNLIAWSF
jgi:hypothetical protein